jgi:transcriptional regulator with XRE-family HTH domain
MSDEAFFSRKVYLRYDPTILKRARLIKGYTQQQLADIAGVDSVAVSHFETGYRVHDEETLKKILNVLELSLTEVCQGTNGKQSPSKLDPRPRSKK